MLPTPYRAEQRCQVVWLSGMISPENKQSVFYRKAVSAMDYTLTVQRPFDQIIHNLIDRLRQRDLQTQVSFNACLKQTETGGACPYHGQQPCTCRYAVLLVYNQAQRDYRTITVYGRDDEAWLTLVWQPALNGQDPEAHETLEILLLGILLSLTQPFPVAD
jgi:hypothetical protein